MEVSDIRRKVISAISRHAGAMSREQIDQALGTWDRAVKHDLMKSGDLTIDTTAADKRREEREAKERRIGRGPADNMSFMDRLKSKHRLPRGDKGKDDRPLSPTFWKVKHPDGSIWDYKLSPSGALSSREEGQYKIPVYTLEEWQKLHQNILKKSKKEMLIRGRALMAIGFSPKEAAKMAATSYRKETTLMKTKSKPEPRQPWGQSRSLWGNQSAETSAPVQQTQPIPQSTPTRQPWGTLPRTFAGRIPTAGLTGHQSAALRCGVDIDKVAASTLASMDHSQMKALASEQTAASVSGLAEKASLAYVRDPRQRKW